MRDDEAQRREVPEQVALQELHEGGGVGVDVVGAGRVEVAVAGAGDVDHRRHVQLDHLLEERIPGPVGERWPGPVPARRVRVQVAADEAQLRHAALQLRDGMGDRHTRRLRQLADAHEVLRKEVHHALDQVVAAPRPGLAHRFVADMVCHGGGARAEDRQVGAAFAQQAQLVLLHRLADLVVGNIGIGGIDIAPGLEGRCLRLAPAVMGGRRRGVVAMAVDDHARSSRNPCFVSAAPKARSATEGVVPPHGRVPHRAVAELLQEAREGRAIGFPGVPITGRHSSRRG